MINRPDFEWRSYLIGYQAVRLARLSVSIWIMVLAPLVGLILLGGVAVRVFGVSMNVLGPSLFVLMALVLLALVSLPFVRIALLCRAAQEAGTYLEWTRFTGLRRPPTGLLLMQPAMMENYLRLQGVPPHGAVDTVRTIERPAPVSGVRGVASVAAALRDRAEPRDWAEYIGGAVGLGVGVAVALATVVWIIIDAVQSVASYEPLLSLIVSVILIIVGAFLMFSAIRRIGS